MFSFQNFNLRNKDWLLGQLLQSRSCLPVVMLEQLLQLLGIETYAVRPGMLLCKPLVYVEVIAHHLDPPLHRPLRRHLKTPPTD